MLGGAVLLGNIPQVRAMKRKSRANPRIEPHFGTPANNGGRESAAKSSRNSGAIAQKRATTTQQSRSRHPAKKQHGGKSRKRSGLRRVASFLVYWGAVLGVWLFVALAGIGVYHAAKLPQSSSWKVPDRPPNARIVSADGTMLADRGASGGAAIRLGEMSPYLPKAVIAIEDRRFHHHFGIDLPGFARAMTNNLFAGRIVQGGSTITQQLAKNLFLEPSRTMERKIQELVLAFWLEANYSKDAILEMYLNRVYFGSGAHGVDAASRRYFSKSAADITLAESAMLAGLLKAPSRLSPAKNPKLAEQRQQVVLAAMRRANYINNNEITSALSAPPTNAKRYWDGAENHIADWVMQRLEDRIGEVRHDVIVETTIDPALQKRAEAAILDELERRGNAMDVSQGAMVALDGNGAILAMVGGREYAASQYNRAVEARRQPGSAFKPFVYLAALEAGYSPQSIFIDQPVTIDNWTPQNYDRKHRGPVSMSEAMAQSINTVAADLSARLGPDRIIETAHRMGIKSPIDNNASMALGTSEVGLLELTGSYVPFANGGLRANPHIIRSVHTADGKLLYRHQPAPAVRVMRPRDVVAMDQMLNQALVEGTGKAAKLSQHRAAGKTGTSQRSRDGWFVGYSDGVTAGVWFGNDDGSPAKGLTGGSMPARSWGQFMSGTRENAVQYRRYDRLPAADAVPLPQSRPNRLARNDARNIASRDPISKLVTQDAPRPAFDLSNEQGAQSAGRPATDLAGEPSAQHRAGDTMARHKNQDHFLDSLDSLQPRANPDQYDEKAPAAERVPVPAPRPGGVLHQAGEEQRPTPTLNQASAGNSPRKTEETSQADIGGDKQPTSRSDRAEFFTSQRQYEDTPTTIHRQNSDNDRSPDQYRTVEAIPVSRPRRSEQQAVAYVTREKFE